MTKHHREYTDEDRAFFARYVEHRAAVRPRNCDQDKPGCWVEEGPPACDSKGRCHRCHRLPVLPYWARDGHSRGDYRYRTRS